MFDCVEEFNELTSFLIFSHRQKLLKRSSINCLLIALFLSYFKSSDDCSANESKPIVDVVVVYLKARFIDSSSSLLQMISCVNHQRRLSEIISVMQPWNV